MPSWMILNGPCGPEGVREHLPDMVRMYKDGNTLQEIGDKYEVSRERIRQLLSGTGLSRSDGGQAIRAERNKKIREAKRDKKYLKLKGCTFAEYQYLREIKATRAYAYQERNARTRGIPWEFNLGSWWKVWEKSGKWEKKGTSLGQYVMCRFGDSGPYSPDNVRIATTTENHKERVKLKAQKAKRQDPDSRGGV